MQADKAHTKLLLALIRPNIFCLENVVCLLRLLHKVKVFVYFVGYARWSTYRNRT